MSIFVVVLAVTFIKIVAGNLISLKLALDHNYVFKRPIGLVDYVILLDKHTYILPVTKTTTWVILLCLFPKEN